MTDAQDTIELPVFGLTLMRDEALGAVAGDGWYSIGDPRDSQCPRVVATPRDSYVGVYRRRGGVGVSYSASGDGVAAACAALLAEMTPDDVAAIRALGER
jgi:hypothetical protein